MYMSKANLHMAVTQQLQSTFQRCESTAPTSTLLLFLLACIAHPSIYSVKDSSSCRSVPFRFVTAALGGLLSLLLYLQSNVRRKFIIVITISTIKCPDLFVCVHIQWSLHLFVFYCLLSMSIYFVTVFSFCLVYVVSQSFFKALRKHGTDFTFTSIPACVHSPPLYI